MDAWFLTLAHLPEPSEAEVERCAETGQPLPLGRTAMDAIAKDLQTSGTRLVEPVGEWESYGWAFAVSEGDALIHCMLQWGDEWLLMCWAERSLGDRLRGRHYRDELSTVRGRIAAAISSAFDVPEPEWRPKA